MGYSTQVLRSAREALAQRRADRESELAARQQEAYAKLPRLKEIDILLRQSAAKAAQAVFLSGGDAQAAMEAVKQENLALQAQRKALVEENFAPGWLEDNRCPHCGDTGYVGSSMCACLKQLCVQEQRKALGAIFRGSESFETFRLDYYSDRVDPQLRVVPRTVMQKTLAYCRDYARHFEPGAGNLLLTGGTGLGKTHLALAMGRAIGEMGYSVCYESAAGLFGKLEKAKFYPTEETIAAGKELETCDFLIIDDLGTEMPGQFVTSALYQLLNQRLMAGKAMVITTNLNVEEAGQRYSPQIASRLYGEFTRLTFLGEDIRVLKNRLF